MDAPSWDDAETAAAYERFCRRHKRYARANEALVAHAHVARDHHVIDFAAGTGRTTDAILPKLGDEGRVTCVEPARAMRERGEARITDKRVTWTTKLPTNADRVLCGAAIWQMPLDETVDELTQCLATGGAFVFNMPAQYLLEPDEPGGGDDPMLIALVAALVKDAPASTSMHAEPPKRIDDVEQALERAGFRAERWEFRQRFSQAAYRDWLAIPVVSASMLGHLNARERRRRLADAYATVDRRSWRWERWLGWTAWKQ